MTLTLNPCMSENPCDAGSEDGEHKNQYCARRLQDRCRTVIGSSDIATHVHSESELMADEDRDAFHPAQWERFQNELRDHAEQHPGTVITQETYSNIVAWKQSNCPKGQRGQVGTAHERKTWRDKGYELSLGTDGEPRLMMPDKRHGRLLEVVPLPRIAEYLHHVHSVLIGHHGQNKTKQKVRTPHP